METLNQETTLSLDFIVTKQNGEGKKPERSRNRILVPSHDFSAMDSAISAFLSTNVYSGSLIDVYDKEERDEICSDITRMVLNQSRVETRIAVCVVEGEDQSISYNVLSSVADGVHEEEEVSWDVIETTTSNKVLDLCRPAIPCLKRINIAARVSETHEDNEYECSICLQDAWPSGSDDVASTSCGHVFHSRCIAQWLVKHVHCALCRSLLRVC